MIKKIDKLVGSSFVAPYIMSFFVAEFVLVLQFMWKYIDDILGKGFPLTVLFELIFYFAITIVPQAIPLTILISSIMVFGNLSERYELSSMKSAGVSLLRIMVPAIMIAILTAGFSFVSSNYLKPKANFKFYNLFYTMRKQKPSLSIEEGIFNKDFSDYVIRVGKKGKNGEDISDIIIYDHTQRDKDMVNVITAKSGKMYSSETNGFVMELYDGYQYKDMRSATRKINEEKAPLMRTKFESFTKIFDLGEFEVDESSWGTSRNKYDMLSQAQLNASIDSLSIEIGAKIKELSYDYNKMYPQITIFEDTIAQKNQAELVQRYQPKNIDSSLAKLSHSISNPKVNLLSPAMGKQPANTQRYELKFDSDSIVQNPASFFSIIDTTMRMEVLEQSIRDSNGFKNKYINTRSTIISLQKNLRVNNLRKHQQFSWAMVCIVFVFLGAPLGSIIRKGGYGYPLLVAIIFYVSFIISIIMGEKLIKEDDFSAITAAWIPVIMLTPFAIAFTYFALRDVKFDFIGFIQSLFSKDK